MEIEDKKKELLDLIEGYFKARFTVNNLFEYSWKTINYFADNRDKLPPYQEHERVFWYAIWQLQHLCDEEHEEDGSLVRALNEIIEYLKNQKKLPQHYEGKRP